MKSFPVCSVLCSLLVVSCAKPISVKVTTTPVEGVELTLNRTVPQSEEKKVAEYSTPGKDFLTGKSNCVFENVSQGHDLTIVARKEGYEVAQVTIPAKAAKPFSLSLLWSSRPWSSLIWSTMDPRAQYLTLEDAEHKEIDLATEGVTIPMKRIPDSGQYKASALPPFDASQMKGF